MTEHITQYQIEWDRKFHHVCEECCSRTCNYYYNVPPYLICNKYNVDLQWAHKITYQINEKYTAIRCESCIADPKQIVKYIYFNMGVLQLPVFSSRPKKKYNKER